MLASSSLILGPSKIPMGLMAQLSTGPEVVMQIKKTCADLSGYKRRRYTPNPKTKNGRIFLALPETFVTSDYVVDALRKDGHMEGLTHHKVSHVLHQMADQARIERKQVSGSKAKFRRVAK